MTLSVVVMDAVGGSMLPSALMYIVPNASTGWMLNVEVNMPVNNAMNINPENVFLCILPSQIIIV